MRQYNSVKEQVYNALLMFRLGDFYQLLFEDAVTAARELEITLTARNKEKSAAIPMCGVPYHAAEGYIARLVQKGYRVYCSSSGSFREDSRGGRRLGCGYAALWGRRFLSPANRLITASSSPSNPTPAVVNRCAHRRV
jgi:hypothetical protein